MRGSPLLSLLLLAMVLLALGLPVWSLTRKKQERLPESKQHSVSEKKWLDMTLTSSAPGIISVTSLDRILLKSSSDSTFLEGHIEVLAKNPDDLVVSAKWKNSSIQNALRVEIKNNGKTCIDTTFWGTASIEDTLPLPSL